MGIKFVDSRTGETLNFLGVQEKASEYELAALLSNMDRPKKHKASRKKEKKSK